MKKPPRTASSPLVRVLLTLIRLPLLVINWTGVAVFYMLALTKFIRYSDMMNDLNGINGAVISMHQYVVPFVDLQTISRAYGSPIVISTFNLSDSGASVRMRLSASTEELNHPTGSGSAKFYSNWAMTTLNVTSTTQLPAFCAMAKASATGIYEQFNTSTTVLYKPNVDGGQLNLWAGVQHLPTTIKATTQVVTLKVSVNKGNPSTANTMGCLYRLKLYHAEAFELWNSDTATFNILQADFQINDTSITTDATTMMTTPPPVLSWIFDPRVTRLNWFFYRRQSPELNTISLISQVVGFALLFASGRRVISTKSKMRTAQVTRTSTTQEKEFDTDDSEAIVTKRIAHHHLDPTASQGLYYNSLVINLAEIYIILNDRYMIFRCINALDFFMTAGWGFHTSNMWLEYVNIMGNIFWLVLGMHKLISLMLYVIVRFVVHCCKRTTFTSRNASSSIFMAGLIDTSTSTKTPSALLRKTTNPVLTFVKEATRPRPDLIVLLMIGFPKFFYAHFFGGATAWASLVDLPTTTSLSSNLGANLLIANILCCGILIMPLNTFFVLVAPRHVLRNGWIQLRQPGRVYYQRMMFCRPGRKEFAFDEGKLDSLFALLFYQLMDLVIHYNQRMQHDQLVDDSKLIKRAKTTSNAPLELCVSLRFHDLMHDSLIGELQAFYGVTRAENVDKACMRYVEHPPCASPFWFFPVVVVAEYGNRGMLLTWPSVATNFNCGINKLDFTKLFLKRVHLIGADHHLDFADNVAKK